LFHVLGNPTDLAKDGIERMLQGAVEAIALRCPQFVEVALDALSGVV
jgi:hypothetical protein